jgi:hypothetical protein
MLHICEHISIGSLAVWLDWMPLSECTTTERDWMSLNILWVRVNVFMQVLNVLECTLSKCERLWVSIKCGWLHLSVREHLWVSLNMTECTYLLIPTWKWVCMNIFEWVWIRLDAFECALRAREHLWTSIECTWMHSECMWTPLSKYWMWLNALECSWVHVNATEWVLNLY